MVHYGYAITLHDHNVRQAAITKQRAAPKPTKFSEVRLNSEAIFAESQGAQWTIAMSLRLGVDVGGTNTDAVLLHGGSVMGSA